MGHVIDAAIKINLAYDRGPPQSAEDPKNHTQDLDHLPKFCLR